jgi:hypothetical protein
VNESAALPIQFIDVSDHYDHPLAGWVRIESRYYWFTLSDQDWVKSERWFNDETQEWVEDEYEWAGTYTICAITDRSLKAVRLLRTRMFRHMVGWYWSHRPGQAGARGYHTGFARPPEPGNFWGRAESLVYDEDAFARSLVKIGTSADRLRTMIPLPEFTNFRRRTS